MLFNVWNVSLPQLQCRCSCQYFCSIPECVCIATTAMSTLMPIFLLYLGGCIGGSCVYTCTVHWTVQLSCEQPGHWPLFIVCTAAKPMSPNFFQICIETNQPSNRPTNLKLSAIFVTCQLTSEGVGHIQVQGVSKKIDLLYLLDISGTKNRISKPFFSSENWDPYVNFEYRTISVRY